jgi:tetratricopeptide (TPR) repeat protein
MCDESVIHRITALMQTSDEEALAALAQALQTWSGDARLYLLRGAIFASQNHPDEARMDLSRAIVLDPELDTARFLLGYLELTAGAPMDAIAVWGPLAATPESALGSFAAGMIDLIEDRLSASLAHFNHGLQAPAGSAALMPFIRSIIERTEQALNESAQTSGAQADGAIEHFLLADYLAKPTQH